MPPKVMSESESPNGTAGRCLRALCRRKRHKAFNLQPKLRRFLLKASVFSGLNILAHFAATRRFSEAFGYVLYLAV